MSDGKKVIAIDNLVSGNWERCSEQTIQIEADLSKLSVLELAELFSGCSEIYHLAAVKLHNERNTSDDVIVNNIVATDRIFEACGIAGVSKVFFASSLYAYGSMGPNAMKENDLCTPTTNYGLSKLWGENSIRIYALKYGFSYVIGRLFFIYGPKQFSEGGYKSVMRKNIERLKLGESFLVSGDGQQELDYLHVNDCVRLINKLLSNVQNCTINLSRGVGVSINEIAKIVLDQNGGGLVEHTPSDWTHGSKRIGDNTNLRSIFPNYSFIDMQLGIESMFDEEY